MIEDEREENLDHTAEESANIDQEQEENNNLFDPGKFMGMDKESSLSSENNSSESNDEEETSNSEDDEDSTDDSFSWDSLSSGTEAQEEDQSTSNEERESNDSNDEESNNDLEQEAQSDNSEKDGLVSPNFESIQERLGVDSPEDAQKRIDELIEENQRLQEKALSGQKNEQIENYSNLKRLPNDELVKRYLSSQGLSEEDIEIQMNVYEQNGTIGVEANKVRNKIDGAIKAEQYKLKKQIEEQKEQQAKADQQYVNELKTTIDSTDEFFGMKIASDPDKFDSVRKEHFQYIVNGDFAREIGENMKNLTEAAWLWKNRNAILSRMKKAGRNTGRKEILDSLSNVNTNSNTTRQVPPNPNDESAGFDPDKFLGKK